MTAALELLNSRWTLHIVRSLLGGKKRFNEIARADSINPRTLSERLKFLEAEGLVTRHAAGLHVEYELTEKGLALQYVVEAVGLWGSRWMPTATGQVI